MKFIDVPEALELLQAAVDERGPETTYHQTPGAPRFGCQYWHDNPGVPGCIVGLGLYLKGYVSGEALRTMDDAPISTAIWGIVRTFGDSLPFSITREAVFVLEAAQMRQDGNDPWWECLEAAQRQASWLAPEGEGK